MTDKPTPRVRTAGPAPTKEQADILARAKAKRQLHPKAVERMQEASDLLQEVTSVQAEEQARKVPLDGPELDDPEPEIDDLGDADYYTVYSGSIIDNPKARREIEERCKPIDFSQVLHGRIRQIVPIHPQHLVVEFQTITNGERLFLQQYCGEKAEGRPQNWVVDVFQVYFTAMGINSINDQPLPEIVVLPKTGEVDQDEFDKRITVFNNMAEDVVESLVTNYRWFKDRVGRSLRRVEPLKNG